MASGALTIDQRFALALPWREAAASLIPPAYKEGAAAGVVAPVYPPGLPLAMAALLRVTGVRDAVFYVVPILAALAVWATGLLGARLHSRLLGAGAAVLLATSPSFIYQITQPVSDIPAAAWWTLALLLTLQETAWAAGAAGVAAALAILTRPNLMPAAIVLMAFQIWKAVRAGRGDKPLHQFNALVFGSLVLIGCLFMASFNNHLYGSPLRSGYAPLRELYEWKNVPLNLDRYPRWLLSTQTPFIYLGLVAPWIARDRARARLLLAFAAVVVLCYLPYGYFDRDAWIYLRFLLPAYPPLIVLSLVVAATWLRRAIASEARFVVACVVLVAALGGWQLREAVTRGALTTAIADRRYVDAGRYISTMPREAVFIAGLHAGSIRYYGGQLTVYYSRLHFRALDDCVAALTAMGRRPYIVLEEGEEADFRWHFGSTSDLGRLDWPPAVQTRRGVPVRIYDPTDRARFLAGQPVVTYDMANVEKPVVTQK